MKAPTGTLLVKLTFNPDAPVLLNLYLIKKFKPDSS